MKNFNLLRKSERKSVGTTLALTVGSPSAHRRYSALKHLTFMLLFLLGSLNVWGASPETISFASYSTSGTASQADFVITWDGNTSCTIVQAKGTGNNVANNTTSPRWYQNNSITITPKSGITITKIVFTGSGSNYNGQTMSFSAGSGSVSSNATTWNGSITSSSSLVVTPGKQFRPGSVVVTYTTGGTTEPSLTVTPATIDFGTVEQGASVAAKTVAVTYANLTGSVTYSGLSDPFAATGTISASGDEITITPSTATIGEYEQTLTIQSTACDSKSQEVTVTMNVVAPFDGLALTFPDYNDKGVSSYTSSWTATKSGQVWTINNFNNNSNGWSLIKAGRNGNASVATITTQVEDHAISDVTVTIDAVTAAKINSHKLYVADNSSFTDAIEISGDPATIAAGSIVYTVPVVNRTNDLYYKLEYDCASGTANGFLQISKIAYAYAAATPQKDPAGLAYDDSDLSNLVKLGDAFTAPTLTNPHSLTVAYESSNTDVAEVASNGALTIKAVGVAEITASFAGDEDYKAGSAQYALYVVAHEGTEADPYTVADARVVIDKVGDTGIADKYATGIVSKIVTAFNPTYGNITYDISSDGTTESAQLRAYRGFDKDGAWFTSEDDVMVGDEVVVKGLLKKFGSTYEFDAGNQLVSLNRSKAAAGLAYTETAVEKNIGDAAFTNTLTNPNSLDVTYSSTATGVATVDENGEVTIVGVGTTTIKATFAGNASYLADEVSYTLTVEDPSLIKVTFDATIDKGESPLSKSNISLSCSNGVLNNESEYRLYKNSITTFACSVGNIAMIEFIGVSGNPASGFEAPAEGDFVTDGNNATWTGNAASVAFTASGAQVRATKIFVSYREDTRAEAGLEYAETAIEKEVGDDAFVNELTNPNSVDVTYESSDTDVAEVANDGTVTIKAQGTITITASFEGNATYKPASVSYELTVNEPGLDNVTFNSAVDQAASGETTITKGGFTLVFSAGSMDGAYSEYRLYKNQTMTLSSTDYKIKKIEFTCAAGNPINGFEDATGLDKENNQWTGDANKVELTASNAQVRITQLVVYYVEDTRAASGLAWSSDEVEITLGDDFSAASLVNPNNIDAAEISIESDNTDLATVNNGAVELVADATGTATITATFAGNATYKPAEFSYTIKVNDPTPVIYVDKLNVNFGTVAKDASVGSKQITVTLQNVAAATAVLGGTNPAAFSIDDTEIANGDVITISVASTATLGSYSATITITDNAAQAEQKVVNLSLSVEEVETSVSTSSKWVAATAADLVDGAEVLITGVKESATYAMGVQNNNNRAAVLASVDGEGVLTPGEGTMSLILEDQGDGTFALRTSNGKYLYAASSTANQLKTRDAIGEDGKAVWTISIAGNVASIVANCETENWRNTMRFNLNNTNPPLFACYASATQNDITLYVPQPAPTKEVIRGELSNGKWGTICPKQNVEEVEGATFYQISYLEEQEGMPYNVVFDAISGTTLTAGQPYFFIAEGTEIRGIKSGDAVTSGSHVNGFYGWISPTDASMELTTWNVDYDASANNTYVIYDNSVLRINQSGTMLKSERCYININSTEPSRSLISPMPGRNRIRMSVQNTNTATGMDAINASEKPMKMVIEGQLYILRGEKMYNAKGQLVK